MSHNPSLEEPSRKQHEQDYLSDPFYLDPVRPLSRSLNPVTTHVATKCSKQGAIAEATLYSKEFIVLDTGIHRVEDACMNPKEPATGSRRPISEMSRLLSKRYFLPNVSISNLRKYMNNYRSKVQEEVIGKSLSRTASAKCTQKLANRRESLPRQRRKGILFGSLLL